MTQLIEQLLMTTEFVDLFLRDLINSPFVLTVCATSSDASGGVVKGWG